MNAWKLMPCPTTGKVAQNHIVTNAILELIQTYGPVAHLKLLVMNTKVIVTAMRTVTEILYVVMTIAMIYMSPSLTAVPESP